MSSEKDAAPSLSADLLRRAPKVLLHEHLDGGLRPETCLELADACGGDATRLDIVVAVGCERPRGVA